MKHRTLNIFISYARTNEKIADAVYNALKRALGNTFLTEIFLDKSSITEGLDFREEIERFLDKTDVFIIIYTESQTLSHSYTGWEVGYFRKVQTQTQADLDFGRRIIPLFLNSLPPTETTTQSIHLGVSISDLKKNAEDFRNSLKISNDDPMVRFIKQLQETVHKFESKIDFPKQELPEAIDCVRDIRIEIFSYLHTTVSNTLKPQKQFIIRTSLAALELAENNLPNDAILTPLGSDNTFGIFGLLNKQISWQDFGIEVSKNTLGDSWQDAINRVVGSSLPDQINVDNSQIILSEDQSRVYRIILATSTTYYNGNKEFHLYLVQGYRSTDYGDKDTTLLLKGLQIVCRFRFMFLEHTSEFYFRNIQTVSLDKIRPLSRRMVIELDLLRRNSREAGLEEPRVWSDFVGWEDLLAMNRSWYPMERKLRSTASEISSFKGNVGVAEIEQHLEEKRNELVTLLQEMEKITNPFNRMLIQQMSKKLEKKVSNSP